MIRLRRIVAFATLTSMLALGVVMYAQRDAPNRHPGSLNVTDDVLRRAGTANDLLLPLRAHVPD